MSAAACALALAWGGAGQARRRRDGEDEVDARGRTWSARAQNARGRAPRGCWYDCVGSWRGASCADGLDGRCKERGSSEFSALRLEHEGSCCCCHCRHRVRVCRAPRGCVTDHSLCAPRARPRLLPLVTAQPQLAHSTLPRACRRMATPRDEMWASPGGQSVLFVVCRGCVDRGGRRRRTAGRGESGERARARRCRGYVQLSRPRASNRRRAAGRGVGQRATAASSSSSPSCSSSPSRFPARYTAGRFTLAVMLPCLQRSGNLAPCLRGSSCFSSPRLEVAAALARRLISPRAPTTWRPSARMHASCALRGRPTRSTSSRVDLGVSHVAAGRRLDHSGRHPLVRG